MIVLDAARSRLAPAPFSAMLRVPGAQTRTRIACVLRVVTVTLRRAGIQTRYRSAGSSFASSEARSDAFAVERDVNGGVPSGKRPRAA